MMQEETVHFYPFSKKVYYISAKSCLIEIGEVVDIDTLEEWSINGFEFSEVN